MFRLLVKLLALGAGVGLALYAFTGGDVDVLLKGATPLTTVVQDDAHLLSEPQKLAVRDTHMKILHAFGVDTRILTVPGAVDVGAVAAAAFTNNHVGQRSQTSEGLLLVFAPQSNAVAVTASPKTGNALGEPFMTYLRTRQMGPFFRQGKTSDGIVATVNLIAQRATAVQQRQAFDPRQQDRLSAVAAGITDTESVIPATSATTVPVAPVAADSSPDEVLRAYMHAMRNRDNTSNLPIYTRATREMLFGVKPSPAQMDATAALHQTCGAWETRFTPDGKHAVFRYPINERMCMPWFFVIEDGVWRLDLFNRQKLVRLDPDNRWLFTFGVRNDYQSAFADWIFDTDGYPQER